MIDDHGNGRIHSKKYLLLEETIVFGIFGIRQEEKLSWKAAKTSSYNMKSSGVQKEETLLFVLQTSQSKKPFNLWG